LRALALQRFALCRRLLCPQVILDLGWQPGSEEERAEAMAPMNTSSELEVTPWLQRHHNL